MSVQAESLRDQLQRMLRGEVIAVLEAAEAPVRRVEIHRQCGTAADIEDTHKALMSLARDKQVEEVRDDGGVRAWRLVGDARPAVAKAPKRQPPGAKVPVLNLLIHALEQAGDWLTVEQLDYRCHELSAEQIRLALYPAAKRGNRVIGRPRQGASNRAHEYGLPGWADPTTETGAAAAPEDSDVSKIQQMIQWINDHPGCLTSEINEAFGMRDASPQLGYERRKDNPAIGRVRDGQRCRWYPAGHEALKEPAESNPPPQPEPPVAAEATEETPAGATDCPPVEDEQSGYQLYVPEIRDFRSADFAFRSDGSLIVFPCASATEPFQLSPRAFRELLSYLDAAAPMISEVLGVRHD